MDASLLRSRGTCVAHSCSTTSRSLLHARVVCAPPLLRAGCILPRTLQAAEPRTPPSIRCNAWSNNGKGDNKEGFVPVPAGGRAGGYAIGSSTKQTGNGVFLLMLLCVIGFVVDKVLHLPGCTSLYLSHSRPALHQFVTSLFMHADFGHLSGNLFNLCVFGKMVEETEGAFGVVLTFLLCGVGANIASIFLIPGGKGAVVSMGASGAIFGLFVVSVLTRLSWDLKQLLEAAVLGQFVLRQVWEEAKHQVTGGLVVAGLQVSHVAHLAGAAVGVLIAVLLHKLPDEPPSAGAKP